MMVMTIIIFALMVMVMAIICKVMVVMSDLGIVGCEFPENNQISTTYFTGIFSNFFGKT